MPEVDSAFIAQMGKLRLQEGITNCPGDEGTDRKKDVAGVRPSGDRRPLQLQPKSACKLSEAVDMTRCRRRDELRVRKWVPGERSLSRARVGRPDPSQTAQDGLSA